MQFAFSAEQEMLRDAVRSFLADRAPLGRVRELMESETGHDPDLWAEMAGLGWQGMAIPEEYGGAGFGFFELGILFEEMGRMLTPVPFLSTVVMAAAALQLAGSDDQKKEHLPAIAAGELLATLALAEPGGGWLADEIAMEASERDGSIQLDGVKRYVLDGHIADLIVVGVRNASGALDLVLVPADTEGVTRARLETMDMTRKQAEVRFDGVSVPVANRLGDAGAGGEILRQVYDHAAVALAFEQVGGAHQCLDMAVSYAKERVQFGRAIGSFQAIKHKCADMLVEVELARSAAYYAGWAIAEDDADAAIVAPLAKAYCSEAFFHCASENIQIHGGIGFTWEHDAHLYFKRAKTSQLLLGDPAHWRAVLADRLGL